MIKVEIKRQTGKIHSFLVSGHAETAEHGEDIVCAAVSGIVQTALLGLSTHLERELTLVHRHGEAGATLKDIPDQRTEDILGTMVLGLAAIQKEYPKTIQLQETPANK